MNICPASGFYYSLAYPLDGLGMLMIFLLPGAICVVLWKIFVTNRTAPRGDVLSLGLDESSATYSELYGRNIPWAKLISYAATGVVTFRLGVLADAAYWYAVELLSNLGIRIY